MHQALTPGYWSQMFCPGPAQWPCLTIAQGLGLLWNPGYFGRALLFLVFIWAADFVSGSLGFGAESSGKERRFGPHWEGRRFLCQPDLQVCRIIILLGTLSSSPFSGWNFWKYQCPSWSFRTFFDASQRNIWFITSPWRRRKFPARGSLEFAEMGRVCPHNGADSLLPLKRQCFLSLGLVLPSFLSQQARSGQEI